MKTVLVRQASLAAERAFRRILAMSLVGHAVALGLFFWTPFFSLASTRQAVVVVEVLSSMPAPPPPPAPAPPEPEPAPPEPPQATPPPEPPRQVIEEAVVVPAVPKEKPPRPKPKPAEPKPDPKPPEPQASAADVMSQLRQSYEPVEPRADASQQGAPGLLDPELAAYQKAVTRCIQGNLVGALQFYRRRDLEVAFRLTLEPTGAIREYAMTRSSGNRQLDNLTESALERCKTSRTTLPPPPRGQTVLPIVFTPGEMR